MTNVTIYSSNLCPFCFKAKALLNKKNIAYREIIVDMKPDLRAEMRRKAGGINTVPQIFFADTHIGGCDDLHALEASGALESALKEAAKSQTA